MVGIIILETLLDLDLLVGFLIFLMLAIVFGLMAWVAFKDNFTTSWKPYCIMAIILFIVSVAMIVNFIKYPIKYKVLVDQNTDFLKFYETYEVLDYKANIFYVKEKQK